ncbi:hypothetical protein ACIBG8_03180 [Nonomuraea sp. NPDC050556]|uniref:hypothetical protein n=1 Tax=Nonomuraea sp. NPDC050556 TaxID=3364369 RepID=UPI00379FD772
MTVDPRSVRFEATVHPAAELTADVAQLAADLDLDRVPDQAGDVRVLIDLDEVVRLLDQGVHVHLQAAVPVRPLDADLIMGDDAARAWIEGQL